jgi:hypothetical protein
MDKIDFDDLTEEEIDEILFYSGTEDNIAERYVVACQLIANMLGNSEPEIHSNNEMVDMTICKMILDGYVAVEKNNRKYH